MRRQRSSRSSAKWRASCASPHRPSSSSCARPTRRRCWEREEALRVPLDSLVAAGALGGYRAVSTWVPSHATAGSGPGARRRAIVPAEAARWSALAPRLGEGKSWAAGVRRELAGAGGDITINEWLASPASAADAPAVARTRWAMARVSVVDLEGVNAANVAPLRAGRCRNRGCAGSTTSPRSPPCSGATVGRCSALSS